MSGYYIGRVKLEDDPWADAAGAGGSEIHQGELLKRYAHALTRQVHAVELAGHQLQAMIDSAKLALMTDSRAEVERVRDAVARVFDDLLAALPEPQAQRDRLLDRLRGLR